MGSRDWAFKELFLELCCSFRNLADTPLKAVAGYDVLDSPAVVLLVGLLKLRILPSLPHPIGFDRLQKQPGPGGWEVRSSPGRRSLVKSYPEIFYGLWNRPVETTAEARHFFF